MSVPPEERFAKNAAVLGQAIKDAIHRLHNAGYKTANVENVDFAVAAIVSFPPTMIIQTFIQNSHKICWDKIHERDESFFIENAGSIFGKLPSQDVNMFRDLVLTKDDNGNSVVSQQLKQQIWDLFHAMVKISIKYVHALRAPYTYQSNGETHKVYGAKFFDEIDIVYHANKWKLIIDFPPKI